MKINNFLLLAISFLLLINSISFANAGWDCYGGLCGSYNALSSIEGDKTGIFNQGKILYAYNSIIGTNYNPLIAEFPANSTFNATKVIISKGNYLYVLNGINLVIEKQYFVGGSQLSDMAFTDFDGDGKKEEIVGIFDMASGGVNTFWVLKYNITSEDITPVYSQNLTNDTSAYFSGIKCYPFFDTNTWTCVFSEASNSQTNLTQINNTGKKTCKIPTGNIYSGEGDTFSGAVSVLEISGTQQFLLYRGAWSGQNFVDVIDKNCNELFNLTRNSVGGGQYYGNLVAEWFFGIGNPKIAIAYDGYVSGGSSCFTSLYVKDLDGSDWWSKTLYSAGSCGIITQTPTLFLHGGDWNNDGYNDVWLGMSDGRLYIFNGLNGNTLLADDGIFSAHTITADMNTNGVPDAIIGGNIINLQTNTTIQDVSPKSWCIPYDIIEDNYLDLVCSQSSNGTSIYIANYSNQNAYINSVAFDPSTTITLGQLLIAYISATDPDPFDVNKYYGIKCGNSAIWTNDSSNNAQICNFTSIGIYNVSVRVRDYWHTEYDTLDQEIIVTQTGSICDNDDVCEAGQGETFENCPHDCPYSSEENTTQAEGGTSIPTQLVDVDNIDSGLLPSIYYGTLGFFSNILSPFFIIVVLFLSIAIILTIIAIAIKLVKKASNLG